MSLGGKLEGNLVGSEDLRLLMGNQDQGPGFA